MTQTVHLADQLAVLGIDLPAWPEESPQDAGGTEDTWIQRGLTTSECIQIWWLRLRTADQSTRAVVDQLLSHLRSETRLDSWDAWLRAALRPCVLDAVELDRWEDCIEQLLTSPLTPSQLLGASLALATIQQLAGAAKGIRRLLREWPLSDQARFKICARFVASANTSWRLLEAEHSSDAWRQALDLHSRLSALMGRAASQLQDSVADPSAAQSGLIELLDQLIVLLGDDDRWEPLPRSQARELLLVRNDRLAAQALLAASLPGSLSPQKREGHARALCAQLLTRAGRWEEANALHRESVASLQIHPDRREAYAAQLEILRSETELLSHELSLALANGSLDSRQVAAAAAAREGDGNRAIHWQPFSRSQLGQDLWVLEKLNWKRDGYFVEFGATDGVLLSNTWLLEKYFGWTGICAEPHPGFFKKLMRNRSCELSPACVYRVTGQTMKFLLAAEYGGLVGEIPDDAHAAKRQAYEAEGDVMEVETISLADLLARHHAPAVIDYLSIDTEGSELEILRGFDWSLHQFRCITVEHNFTAQREAIRELLEANGYERTESQWDDWYCKDIAA